MEIIAGLFSTVGVFLIFLLVILSSAIKIVQEYERGVIFRLGRLQGAKGPGLFLIIPIIDRMVKVDLRVRTLDIPAQEAITRDNVTVKVNAVSFYRVIDPSDAIVQVEDFNRAMWQIAQTSLRSVLGQSDLDELLIHRDQINHKLQQIIDEATEPWGIKVSIVEVKDGDDEKEARPPGPLQASQAENDAPLVLLDDLDGRTQDDQQKDKKHPKGREKANDNLHLSPSLSM